MVNINEFKNKLQEYQGGVDYIYDEGKKTYTICHEELKKIFWGDASNEVEYKAIEDSRSNIQFRKSAIFRSSKTMREENNSSLSIHSIEKMRDKQWQEKNLGTFPKKTSVLPSNLKNSENDFRKPTEFEESKEEFGYYREWRPFEEPTNTVYHWKKEGDNYFERKTVWKDSNSQTPNNASQIQEITDEKDQKLKKETNQNIYYGVGLVSLVLLLISMVVIRTKKKK